MCNNILITHWGELLYNTQICSKASFQSASPPHTHLEFLVLDICHWQGNHPIRHTHPI